MLVAYLLKGILVGAVIAVPVGPVGILCMRRTILAGRLAGLASGLGAATADAAFAVIAGFGLTLVSNWFLDYEDLLRTAGGCYLLYAGGSAFFAKPNGAMTEQSDPESLLRDFVSTFALTVINPVTILVLLGVFAALGLGGARATLDRTAMLVLGVWIGSFLWWLAISLGFGLFRRAITPQHLVRISHFSAAVLFLSGAALLATAITRHIG